MFKYDKNKCQFIKISLKYWFTAFCVIFIISMLIGFISYYVGYSKGEREIVFTSVLEQDTGKLTFVNLDYDHIRKIESNNNNEAVSALNAVGSMQITQDGLDDWNKVHPKEQYVFDDLFDKRINHKIGKWLLSVRIPYYLKSYHIPEKITYKLIIYNAGIGNFLKVYNKNTKTINIKELPEETRDYLVKYWSKY